MTKPTADRPPGRVHLPRWCLVLGVLIGVLLSTALAGGGAPPSAAHQRAAIHDVLALFGKTPIVAFGEIHGLEQQHTFLRALIADPQFGRTVQTIVVEFGNAKYQSIADAYVLDQRSVSRDELA
jgi:hypothetical protein